MFWFGLVILLFGLVSGFLLRKNAIKEQDEELRLWSRVLLIGGAGVFVVCLVLSSVYPIPAGAVGVQTVFGKVQSKILHEGLNLKNPIASVTKMTTRTQTYTMSIVAQENEKDRADTIKVLSKDNLEVDMDLSVLFSLQSSAAPDVFRHLGDTTMYVEKLVRPAIRTAIRDVASRYNAADLMSSARTAAESEIQDTLDRIFKQYFLLKNLPIGIICERVLLRNVQPPATLKAAIEDKLAKQQQRDAMQFVLETEKAKAEQKVIEARGLADAQAIINKTLTKEYLQWKYIETLQNLVNSPNNTVVILPFDQKLTPLLNVSSTNVSSETTSPRSTKTTVPTDNPVQKTKNEKAPDSNIEHNDHSDDIAPLLNLIKPKTNLLN